MDKKAKNILTLLYIWGLRLISHTITFSVKSQMEKCESDASWSKNSRKVFTSDIFIYERTEVLRGSKKCRMNLFIEQRTAKHHNKDEAKTLKIQDISVRRDVKVFSEENCPCGRQMPKQLWQRKKGGKYEWTEGTTIIYVNNVPLLLIISGKIKQKREGGEGGGASRMSPN